MTAFTWRDYLVLAELLDEEMGTEAALRTAISRAYYAAYHAAAAFVRATGILPVGHTHTTVWRSLIRDGNPERTDIGARGMVLKRSREKADYRDPFPGDLNREARTVIIEARDLLDALERLA